MKPAVFQITKRWLTLGLAVVMLSGQVTSSWAADEDPFGFFQEEAKVITASRRSQPISEIPMAVDVVTPEEIKATGATNLWDLFRFRVGMDVIDGRSFVDGNRAVVSVRGFPQLFAANLLVLVDGRSVYTAQNNGTYWDELPVQMQDIQRIEIIRGPNTALYGTGAALGVINIITRKPTADTELTLDNRGGSLGMVQSAGALQAGSGKMAVRASYTYHTQSGFPKATDGHEGNDFFNKQVGNLRADWALSEKSDLEFFTGGATSNVGIPATDNPRVDFDTHFQMAKLSHQFSPESTVELSGARNDTSVDVNPILGGTNHLRTLQYDSEVLHRLDAWEKRSNTTYGISFRHTSSESLQQYASGDHAPYVELYRGFLQQMIKPVSYLAFQGSIAAEHSNVSGLDPSYQTSVLLTPVKEHAFRISYSVAHTVRELFPLFVDYRSAPTIQFEGNPDLPSYKVTSYEAGYHGLYSQRHLEVDAGLFYTTIKNFDLISPKSITFNPLLITLGFSNYDSAIARGIENQLKYRFSQSRWIYVNYTYEHITDAKGDRGLRTESTPAHKVNFGGASDLGLGFSGSLNVGYKDRYFITAENSGSVDIPAYWRLDARLAYTLPWYKDFELFVSGQNLTAKTHQEFADGLTVPRTYQGGVSVKFGGN